MDFEIYFFANIPNFVVEKESEIKIGWYWVSGCNLFFITFFRFSQGAKRGVPHPQNFIFFGFSLLFIHIIGVIEVLIYSGLEKVKIRDLRQFIFGEKNETRPRRKAAPG